MGSMKALITGGAGFIGSHLAERLVKDGWDITVIDDFSTGRRENLATIPHVRIVERSVNEGLGDVMDGVDVVFHLAAAVSVPESINDPEGTHHTNVDGLVHVLEAMRASQTRRIVFASSAAVYGSHAPFPTPERAPLAPESPYGLHKVIGEQYLTLYRFLFGFKTTSLRFFNVYGPRQRDDSPYSGVVAKFMECARGGKPLTIFGDGTQTRDFVAVSDVVTALLSAAKRDEVSDTPLNIGSGKAISINELAETVCRTIGVPYKPIYQNARLGDIVHSVADISLAQNILNWSPQTSLVDGLARIV